MHPVLKPHGFKNYDSCSKNLFSKIYQSTGKIWYLSNNFLIFIISVFKETPMKMFLNSTKILGFILRSFLGYVT